jgi:hypothetical protein
MKTILLFSRDPGGANTVIPLVGPLRDRGYEVMLYGKDVALDKYRQAGYEGVNICGLMAEITPDTVLAFLEGIMPDAIITGTSADDYAEKYLWLAAGKLGIPSMAIMDQWVNYGIRFSKYGVSGINEYLNNRKHPYLPTRIIMMDEYARQEIVSEGLPDERIRVCGQPYFEQLLNFTKAKGTETALLDEKYGLSKKDFVVVFASEPITCTYGDNAHYWGYTEKTIFSSLAVALEAVARETGRKIAVIIRPHPKENPGGLAEIAADRCKSITWHIDADSHPWTLISRADLVCGMSSMFLIESLIIGKSTCSIQIGLCRNNPFVLDRRGILRSIVDEAELYESLLRIIRDGERQPSAIGVIANPVGRIISELETLLCLT